MIEKAIQIELNTLINEYNRLAERLTELKDEIPKAERSIQDLENKTLEIVSELETLIRLL